MRPGTLRHRVSIQYPVQTSDGMGGYTEEWATAAQRQAAIWPVSSRERLDALKLESEVTHRIRVRYLSGVTSKHRILFGSRAFNIIGAPINHEERNIHLDILATEQI